MFNWLLELFYWIIWIFSYLISWKNIFVIALMLVKLMTSSSVRMHYSAPKNTVWPHKSKCFDVPNIPQCIQKGKILYVMPYALWYQNHPASSAFILTARVHVVSVSSVLADSPRASSVSWNWLRIVGSQWKKDSLGVNRNNGIWENVKNLLGSQLIASVWSI